jgi:glycosyltransferase involved in cell wall biosynthesis
MGKAVVSTDVGDIRDFITDGENGFIIPAGKAYQLAEKVKILAEKPELRIEFGKRARAIAINELDLKITVRKHLEVYKTVLDKVGG